MNIENLRHKWKREEEYAFKGWDFSHLNGRWEDEKIPWDYKEIIDSYLKNQHKLLDMGTGGGEFLLTLAHPYHLTSVTEAYAPNLELCNTKLAPLGIDVQPCFQNNLPFVNNSFDMVINRHESFQVSEVARVLKQDGYFITQQIGAKNDNDLSQLLIPDFKPQFPNQTLSKTVWRLKKLGFNIITAKESFTPIRFLDVGALVYFAKIIEWEFPGFSVDNCFSTLLNIHKKILKHGYLEGTEHRFIIVAKK